LVREIFLKYCILSSGREERKFVISLSTRAISLSLRVTKAGW